MPEYKQKIKFERTFTIQAKDADEANRKLEDLISRIEWDADVECDGCYRDFEDPEVEEDEDE